MLLLIASKLLSPCYSEGVEGSLFRFLFKLQLLTNSNPENKKLFYVTGKLQVCHHHTIVFCVLLTEGSKDSLINESQ